jgi:hypothetical protein
MFYSSIEQFIGHRMDWLIFHLVGDVLNHYFYDVQCKFFGYVRNKKQEGTVASTMLSAQDIPNSNVLLHVMMERTLHLSHPSTAHPKVWTIHTPSS